MVSMVLLVLPVLLDLLEQTVLQDLAEQTDKQVLRVARDRREQTELLVLQDLLELRVHLVFRV